ncbi:C4-dicarboxylate ABC transporter permease [Limnohabitans sp. Rim8]|jgi:TRAP-type C4-dicarboxylate transport system permease small subunit|uniref:TRAP transporter small permease protein n=1 Tax=Limnohabitans curvus TaxID=323423 RepID=A0A315ER38_9BURK|nr:MULTISPECIES: TRAP transporter small permease [Limnohabitans]PUE56014.1 C4-dicarboxylate ABC transporter permease [Limnohabitans sp. Rim8]PUE60386.1 C4-dicarboxylate ABC transporter permease [Limnohabitans curvus]
MFNLILDRCCRVLEAAIAFCLALMVVLVFGNVFLRYAMNSGITLSEELSRWAFVWMTFLGAIVALKEHGHLGTDMLVSRLGPFGKKICLGASYVLMLFACWLLFRGAYEQAVINFDSTSAVMEASMSWVYLPGILFAVLGGLILAVELLRLLTGQIRDEDLVMIQESEEVPHGDSH